MDKNSKHKYVPLTNAYSCALELSNNTIDDVCISGIIINIEPIQASDRND